MSKETQQAKYPLIKVRATRPIADSPRPGGWFQGDEKPDVVALWERHPAHPNGEAYVAGQAVVTVAKTPRVGQLLIDQVLEIAG